MKPRPTLFRCNFHAAAASLLVLSGAISIRAETGPAAGAALSHWPQWRGPLANGIAPQANPPTNWSESQNVKWKVQIPGRGTGTPVIWGQQIFVQSAIATGRKVEPAPAAGADRAGAPPIAAFGQVQTPNPSAPTTPSAPGVGPDGPRRRRPGGGGGGRREQPDEIQQFVLYSVDRASGRIQWQKTVREELPHEGHHQDHGFASHSSITDGERVYAWFGSRGLHCYDLKGEKIWEKDFGKYRSANTFGEGGSPALHGDRIFINWDHEGEDFIAAFDKRTGRELWRQARDEKTTWTTPFIVEHGGKTQVVVCASQRIRSYDVTTGKQLWECGGLFANVVPTPVTGSGLLYATSGHRGYALLAIKLGQSGDLSDSAAIAWRHSRSTPYVPSPLLSGERLYFLSGNNAMLSCLNARTGQALFDAERLTGPSGFYASPVGAAGRVYLVGRNGTSLVLKDSDQLEVLATNKLDDRFDASPVVVGGDLLLRGHANLYCLSAAAD